MAAYRRVDGFKSPAGWLPVHRDQLRAQRSVTSMGELYLFYTGVLHDGCPSCHPTTKQPQNTGPKQWLPHHPFSWRKVYCFLLADLWYHYHMYKMNNKWPHLYSVVGLECSPGLQSIFVGLGLEITGLWLGLKLEKCHYYYYKCWCLGWHYHEQNVANKPYLALMMYLYCSPQYNFISISLHIYSPLIGNREDSTCTKSCIHWTGLEPTGLGLQLTGLEL